MRTRFTLIAVVIGLAAAPGAAFAQLPTDEVYAKGIVEQHLNTPEPPTSPGTPVADHRSSVVRAIPFTGLELGLVVVAGLALLGMGFAIRRASQLERLRV